MTYYVVVHNSFEYDDQWYSETEDGGGIPVRVYKLREKAEAAAFRMNKEDPPLIGHDNKALMQFDVFEVKGEPNDDQR